jgi:hypothetical protein
MRLPFWLLRLLPMWDYLCPKCRSKVKQKSHKCPYCGENYGIPLRVPPEVLKDKKALSDYVHKHIFPKVSQAHRDYLAQFFTEIFSDGFESGNFNAWTGTTGTISVETTDPHLGTYHAQHTSSSQNSVSECYKSISNQVEAYMRLYLKFPTVFTGTSADGWETGPRLTTAGIVGAQAKCKYDGSNYYWGVEVYESSGWQTYWGSAFTLLSKYYCIELYFKVGQSDGAVALWVDEVQQVSQSGLDTNDYGDYITNARDRIQRRTGSDAASLVYTDCVVVADAYIGPEAEVTVKTVTDSLSSTDSVLRNKTFSVSDVIGLSDVLLRNKTLVVTDSVGANDAVLGNKSPLIVADAVSLSELINVITEALFKSVTDQVSLSDGAKVLKQLGVSDAVTLVDGVNVTERILRVLDAVALADTLHVNKFLQVTEAISLAEVIQVGVGGVKKTKLFLILGELAVQLTGD